VLIVDDHAAFRASARALLEAEGFDVVGEAADGAAALRAVGSRSWAPCSPYP
jgi:DNA-binding NarL/FixJ family response regulator